MKECEQIYGDKNPWLFGGAWLCDDEVIYLEGLDVVSDSADEDDDSIALEVYRFSVTDDPSKESWVDIEHVAAFVGMDVEDFQEQPFANQWIDIGSYYGFNELDSYPDKFTKAELSEYLGVDL